MIHPNSGYSVELCSTSFPLCKFENKDVVCEPIFVFKPKEIAGFKSIECGCSWPSHNKLDYLEYAYERSRNT